jgi:hypothetical protein
MTQADDRYATPAAEKHTIGFLGRLSKGTFALLAIVFGCVGAILAFVIASALINLVEPAPRAELSDGSAVFLLLVLLLGFGGTVYWAYRRRQKAQQHIAPPSYTARSATIAGAAPDHLHATPSEVSTWAELERLSQATKVRPRRQAWAWGLGIAVLLGLMIYVGSLTRGPSLELNLSADDPSIVIIRNVGEKPLRVTGLTINDRPECVTKHHKGIRTQHGIEFEMQQDKFPSQQIPVGDTISYWSTECSVVRLTVQTDAGSASYTFKQN